MLRGQEELSTAWRKPSARKPVSDETQGEYDFHAFCLEIMDVIWAWTFAGCVVLVLLFLVYVLRPLTGV